MNDLDLAVWRKSSRGTDQGNCVEVGALGTTHVVRDSKNPTGPALRFARAAWSAFTTGNPYRRIRLILTKPGQENGPTLYRMGGADAF